MNRPELRERLAKAYCALENQFKVVDPVLIESMIDNILGKEKIPDGEGIYWHEE